MPRTRKRKGGAVNNALNNALYNAAMDGNLEEVVQFIADGADINKAKNNGMTPLYAASYNGHLEVIKELLQAGADVNKSTNKGATPLYVASQNGHLEVVKELQNASADINKPANDDSTPLYIASERGRLEVVKELLHAGANINKSANDGATPLYAASYNGHLEVIKELLKAGADVNKSANSGITPLYAASYNGHLEVIKELLNAGADSSIADKNGKLPIDVAKTPEIRKLLTRKESEPLWAGWSQGDIQKFDLLFTDEGAKIFSCCPVCLKYVDRKDGCLYMHHNCSKLPGFYHKELYNKYKSYDEIEWCTVCGRICKGHRHYKLGLASDKVPEFSVPSPANVAVFFQNDCRGANGGGGLPEKIERIRVLRHFAKELQDYVGQISQKDALEQLTEAMWNAPTSSFYGRRSEKILKEKRWNFEANVFPPNAPPTSKANTNAPNIRRPASNVGLLPTFNEAGNNLTDLEYGIPVVYFHHRLPSGEIKHHDEGIGFPSFLRYMQHQVTIFGTDEFGLCPFNCGAILHPDEVQKAFELFGKPQDALVAEYRTKYNRKFQHA